MNHSRHLSPALAFAVAAAGIGLFSIMDAFMKALVLAMGVYNALFWRTLVGAGFGAIVWRASGGGRPSRRALRLHLARGAVTAVMATLFFWGLARVPMAQAITLTYVAPILALLLGAMVLGERVGRRVVLASAAAFAGVLVVLGGQSQMALGPEAMAGAAAILVSAMLYAINLVIARVQSQAARPQEIAFFQSTIVTLLLALAAPWLLSVPDAASWPKIVIGAALATASLLLLAWAYAHGDTGYLATTEYTSFIYAAVLGFAVFGERLSMFTVVGRGGDRRRLPLRRARTPNGRCRAGGRHMIRVRPATAADVATILRFVRDLATFEREPDAVEATEATLTDALFGAHPAAEALIADVDGKPAGFALFFHNFSTWTGKRGIYLEDLYVAPEARGRGVGKALLRHIAALALERGCARFEWAVLDWNADAIAFYRSIGAAAMDEWTVQRVTGDALHKLAES